MTAFTIMEHAKINIHGAQAPFKEIVNYIFSHFLTSLIMQETLQVRRKLDMFHLRFEGELWTGMIRFNLNALNNTFVLFALLVC